MRFGLGFRLRLRRLGRLILDAHEHVLVEAIPHDDVGGTAGADLRRDLRRAIPAAPSRRRACRTWRPRGRPSRACRRRWPDWNSVPEISTFCCANAGAAAASAAASTSFLEVHFDCPILNRLPIDSRRAIVVAVRRAACAIGHADSHRCARRRTFLRSDCRSAAQPPAGPPWMPPFVSVSGSSSACSSFRERPVVSSATSRIARPSLYACFAVAAPFS